MKTLFLIWHFWPCHEGGSERQCRLIAHALAARGVTCEVWTARTARRVPRLETDHGVTIRRLGLLIPFWTALAERLAAVVRRVQPPLKPGCDLKAAWNRERRQRALVFWVQLPWVWLARSEFMAAVHRRARCGGVRWHVIHLHEPSWLGGVAERLAPLVHAAVLCQEATDPPLPAIGYDTPLRRQLARLRLRPLYAAMTSSMAAGLAARGVPAERILCVRNAVPVPATVADVAANRDVLYVGNLTQGAEWKAFDVLVEAWARTAPRAPGSRLVVVGGGDPTHWREFARLRGCLSSVEFVGRVEDPAPFYRGAALLALPSRVEGMSNALLEAQSWGVPAVASDIPANAAVIEQDRNGILVPVGDGDALAAAFLALLRDPERRARMGRHARARIEADFRLDEVIPSLLQLYATAVAQRDTRAETAS
jgi:glycosyltransferase involved in cell wall biosynthesis